MHHRHLYRFHESLSALYSISFLSTSLWDSNCRRSERKYLPGKKQKTDKREFFSYIIFESKVMVFSERNPVVGKIKTVKEQIILISVFIDLKYLPAKLFPNDYTLVRHINLYPGACCT
jgi:hypothetical protein